MDGSAGTPRPKLYALAIELTAYCNQKCAYCYNAWRGDGGASVSGGADADALMARIDRMISTFEIDHVTLTGGEPFAHKGIFDVLDRFRAASIGIQMISNGGLIDDALARRLAPYRLRFVQCTLNGIDAKSHGEHVGGEGHFDKTVEGIRALVRNGVPVVGCVVVTRKNARAVGEILALFRELGVRQIALSRFSPAGYATESVAELLPSRDDMIAAFDAALPFARAPRSEAIHVSCTMPIPPCAVEVEHYAPIGFGTCAVGTSMQELALGPDGRLRNCTLHRSAIGDVDVLAEGLDLAALVRAPAVTEYRKTLPSFCEGCLHAKTCGGGCGAAAEWVLGSRTLPDPFLWQHVDDDFGARLEAARGGRRRLSIIA